MIKSEEISDPQSCLNRAAEQEPLFVLRGNDELAAGIIRAWAAQYLNQKGGQRNMTPVQYQKFINASLIANQMENWRTHAATTAATAPTTALSGNAASIQK